MVPLAPSSLNTAPPELRSDTPTVTASASPPASVPMPMVLGQELLTYNSVGNPLGAPLGTMQLSGTSASFEDYKGQMTLEYVGELPQFSGYRIASDFLSGARVYRVSNEDQYFKDNPTICGGKPLKFIVAKVTSLEDIQDGPLASIN